MSGVALLPLVFLAASLSTPPTVIYFTTDDGPFSGSREMLSVIERNRIPVNVFAIGLHADSPNLRPYLEAYRRSPLIELGNHSYTHGFRNQFHRYYQQPDAVLADFSRAQKSMDVPTRLARMPGRNMWRTPAVTRTDPAGGRSSADLLAKNGYVIYGWDVEWNRGKGGMPRQSAADMVKELRALRRSGTAIPGHIVLLTHDNIWKSPAAQERLDKFFKTMKADPAFRFAHLSEYPKVRPAKKKAGQAQGSSKTLPHSDRS